MVRGAIDRGVTVFDTADIYGSSASERLLGRALVGRRDEVVLATKGGYRFRERRAVEQKIRRQAKRVVEALPRRRAPSDVWAASGTYGQQDFSPSYLRRSIHASLRRLRTDRIDVYQLHGPPCLLPDLIGELEDLVAIGDVVRFGVGAESVTAAVEWIPARGVEVVQLPFGILDPEAATTAFPEARRERVELWVRGVLGGGVLGLADRDPFALRSHPKRGLVESLTGIADDAGLDTFQLAFGFLRAHEQDVSTVLVGTSSLAHLERNIALLDSPPLGPDVLDAIASCREPVATGTAEHAQNDA